LYYLKEGVMIQTIPTVGFNVETVKYNNIRFNVWDVGGQDRIRPLWRHYFAGTHGLIFVVDSCDEARLHEAKTELHRILREKEMDGAAVVVFANKQDKKDALPPERIGELLSLHRLKNRQWTIKGSCAIDGSGLVEGLDWLSDNIVSTDS
jgi:ADP-ribosylation factor 6